MGEILDKEEVEALLSAVSSGSVKKTTENILRKGNKSLPIIPGMVAQVDIITGKKSVLDYILKPFVKARQEALRER